MKCLEKDRTRRYDTASALAADVEHYLQDEPVEACPPSVGYRMRKFARRYRAVLLTALLVIVSLISGMAVSVWQAARAYHAEEQSKVSEEQALKSAKNAKQVAGFLEEMLKAAGPSFARGRDTKLLREMLDKTAGRINKDLKDQPEVQGDLWETLAQTYWDIEDYETGITMQKRAVECYRRALGNENTKVARALADLGRNQGFYLTTFEGRQNAKLGLEMARRCGDPKSIEFCLLCMADSMEHFGQVSAETATFRREALEIREKIGGPPTAIATRKLAVGWATTDLAERERLFREAIKIFKECGESNEPSTANGLYCLTNVLIERGKWEEAERTAREAFEVVSRTYDKPYRAVRSWCEY